VGVVIKDQIIDVLRQIDSLPYGYKIKPDLSHHCELEGDITKRDIELSSWWRYLETVNMFCGEMLSPALDIGSGWGTTFKILHELGFEMSALDISNPSKIREESFCLCDLNQIICLPYDDGSYSAVVCSEVIEHIEKPFILLQEIYRILGEDGFIILTTPNILSLRSRFNFLRNSMHSKFIWKSGEEGTYDPKHGEGGHITPLDYYQLNWMLRRVGFRIESLRTNVYEIPTGIKYFSFALLNNLIKLRKKSEYNAVLELGASLIIKARKI